MYDTVLPFISHILPSYRLIVSNLVRMYKSCYDVSYATQSVRLYRSVCQRGKLYIRDPGTKIPVSFSGYPTSYRREDTRDSCFQPPSNNFSPQLEGEEAVPTEEALVEHQDQATKEVADVTPPPLRPGGGAY